MIHQKYLKILNKLLVGRQIIYASNIAKIEKVVEWYNGLGFKFKTSETDKYGVVKSYRDVKFVDDELQNCEMVKCSKCGEWHKKFYTFPIMGKDSNIRLCIGCIEEKGYSTKNDIRVNSATKSGWTYGFEFETISRSVRGYEKLIQPKYNLIPTVDGSLWKNGVEFKSPIYQSLRGVKEVFELVTNNADSSPYCCGTHINIGNKVLENDRTYTNIIYNFRKQLFLPLLNYMSRHQDSVVKICGRYFNRYCSATTDVLMHSAFLNISNNGRFEWRLAKLVTPEQYYNLLLMYRDMTSAIIFRFYKESRKPSTEAYRMKLADACGERLVHIFKRYEKKLCQGA